MKPYKERLPLIDAAIDYHKSWPKHNLWCMVQIKDAGRWLYAFTDHTLTGGKFICTRDEFNERKAELAEKEKGMNNDWYERGELPPVGTECEVNHCGEWYKTQVIGYHRGDIVYDSSLFGRHPYDCNTLDGNFRPLRTETEELQSDILIHWNDKGVDCPIKEWELAEHLHVLGYRKTTPMSEDEFVAVATGNGRIISKDTARQLYKAVCRFLDKGE